MAEETEPKEEDVDIRISAYDDLSDVIDVASALYYARDYWNTWRLLLYAAAQVEKEMIKKEAKNGHQAEKT